MTRRSESRGVTRRDFLTRSGSCAAHLALAASFMPRLARARWAAPRPGAVVVAREPFGNLEKVSDGVWALISTPLNRDSTTVSNGGIVVGDIVPVPADLAAARGVVTGNGTELDAGHGRDVMGHPFAALAWLLSHFSSRGRTVPAGSLVMTGSLVPTRFADAGTDYRFDVTGLGAVALSVL